MTTTKTFRLDDFETPGYARVELLAPKGKINGYQTWRIRIVEILRQSESRRKPKVGATIKRATERWMTDETNLTKLDAAFSIERAQMLAQAEGSVSATWGKS